MEDKKLRSVFYPEYKFFSLILIIIAGYALFLDSPREIYSGLMQIITSRSILITDYMQVGGPGAMLMNGALAGGFGLAMMFLAGVRPNGAIIMALWMTVGFGFFGKNVFNMLPLALGVYLYAKVQRDKFIDYSLAALLVATLSPVVSELAFSGMLSPLNGIALGVVLGVLTGFVFPMISAFTVRAHDGYNLYNMGFAGGVVAVMLIAVMKSAGIEIETALIWGGGFNAQMAGLLYLLSLALIAAGFLLARERDIKTDLRRIHRSSGRLVSDYYTLFGESAYINMGVLGLFSTTLALALGADINGPVMGGILTVMAFGCFGKHMRNVAPIVLGAVISAALNTSGINAPANILAILFSTGLAPVAGQFGPVWGLLAGFIHVSVVTHVAYMSNGLNLYNNGFAAGFVAMLMVPVILSLKKVRE